MNEHLSHCPWCFKAINKCSQEYGQFPHTVEGLLGPAGELYKHLHNCRLFDNKCPVCGWSEDCGFSHAFKQAMHWSLSGNLDELEHIMRASCGESFLTAVVARRDGI
jgi:hypothetical protein